MAMGETAFTDQLLPHSEVYGSDGGKIGVTTDVGPEWILVEKGGIGAKDLFLPRRTIARVEGDHIYLSVTKDEAASIAAEVLLPAGDAWYGIARATNDEILPAGNGVVREDETNG